MFIPRDQSILYIITNEKPPWLCERQTWEKTGLSDCVLSKLLLGDGARAHIHGIYIPVFSVWRRQMKFTLKHVRDMTDVMHLARAYLSTLAAQGVADDWTGAAVRRRRFGDAG